MIVFLFQQSIGKAYAQFDSTADSGICADGNESIPYPAQRNGQQYGITSNMGYRDTGIQGASKWHKGTDYATPCGTQIDGPPAGCQKTGGSGTGTRGGYGNVATFDCGPNNAGQKIMIQYAHLQGGNAYNASTNKITTGNSGVGACHLDYILTIDGKVVDAQCATGDVGGTYTYGNSSRKSGPQCPQSGAINICDPELGNALRQHSDEKFNGSGGRNNYDIQNGSTRGGGGPDSGGQNSEGSEPTGSSTVIDQGTVSGPLVTPPADRPIIEEPQRPDNPEPLAPISGKFNPTASKPRCKSSTCISQDHIDNAKHENVEDDKVQSYVDLLTHTEDCKETDLKRSDVTVFRQIEGGYENYPDAFCLRQGCAHVDNRCQ